MTLGNLKADRGFTLIELLVVIAIIGILSAVVLASLNTARNRGADAAVKSNLSNARAEAELYYDTNSNSYTGVCTSSSTNSIWDNVEAARVAGGGTKACFDTGGTAWAASAQLKTGSQHWCVDSSGSSKQTTAAATGTTCPAS